MGIFTQGKRSAFKPVQILVHVLVHVGFLF
jgi:hypothetical protein